MAYSPLSPIPMRPALFIPMKIAIMTVSGHAHAGRMIKSGQTLVDRFAGCGA